MCGLAGFVNFGQYNYNPEAVLRGMADALVHRGPDDQGYWFDQESGIGLAHRRLAVIDLSAEGHQPMTSHCGRYVIAYNGEIYNYQQIRNELSKEHPDIAWHGASDTEVLLAAISQWGIEKSLQRFNGMFAFALWDRKARELQLARDRFGEKPLYFAGMNNHLIFGSELKALRAHPAFEAELDRDSVCSYMRYCYVPAPHSIYKNVRKLLPASFVSISGAQIGDISHYERSVKSYWSLRAVVETGTADLLDCSLERGIDLLGEEIRKAVGLRMVADVPLGAFLSGGIDSSIVVAAMQSQSSTPIRTFSIGNLDTEYDEAPFARQVAEHIGTQHTELYVRPSDALDIIPKLPIIYDEPFGDSSQIPTVLLSELTRKEVTVSLSGDGGDEFFGGYNRHFIGRAIWKRIEPIPMAMRSAGASLLAILGPDTVDHAYELSSRFLPQRYRGHESPGKQLSKIVSILRSSSPEAMYQALVSTWANPEVLVQNAKEPITIARDEQHWPGLADIADKMMYLDMVTYLAGDILTKVDRASMNASLETRLPFLDPSLAAFAWRLPLSWKVRGTEGKLILRNLLYRNVPKDLVDRPKRGFGVPVAEWLRGPLRDWAESLLAPDILKRQGLLNVGLVDRTWTNHLSRKQFSPSQLWSVLMLQAWMQENDM